MATKKRKRSPVPSGKPSSAPTPTVVNRQGKPVAVWQWRTFPVYMALSTGLAAGFLFGAATGYAHGTLWFVLYVLFFGMFSMGLAHFVTRKLGERMLRRRMQSKRPKSDERRVIAPPATAAASLAGNDQVVEARQKRRKFF